ncbi:MAG: hypothetical protein JSV42_07000 [Chloroflexota bacterium]|nr:MAG: hypothetical protein JSV42_07000 [Chloroflexota bacterium]
MQNFLGELEQIFNEQWLEGYEVVFFLVGDHDEALHLDLETFGHLYDNPLLIPGWLYQVAHNLSLSALRARIEDLRQYLNIDQ